MTVFVWKPAITNPDAMAQDEFRTAWAMQTPCCVFCGEALEAGQRVMHWQAESNILAHAECVKQAARGLLKDIAECMR